MKKKHVVLAAATLSLALTMGAYKSYADAATKKNAKAATESTLTNTEGATQIAASGDSIVVTGDGAVAENGKVTIRKAGTYLLSGTLEEGQLLVDAEEGAEIILVFDGFKISNSTDAPLLFESGSSITLVLKDGSENAVTDLRSSAEENKAAIYTKSDLTISGNGTLDVTGTAEDAIHSKTNVTVQGGTINLKAGDDAIHADETLTILDGKVTVLESEEGLEGLVVDIQGGDITVNASDDGLNASDGSGSDKAPGQATEGAEIHISGGVLTVKAGGDGIDSNGDLIISGGTVVVDGSSDGGNAPIDYDGKGVISGGTVFVSGDSGMFQSLNDSGTTQNSIVYYLSETQAAGTKVVVADSKGNVIYENNSTTQAFNTVLFSAADLKSGENYIVTVGEQSETVSISDTVNNIGENRDGNGPQGGMDGGFKRGERPERPGKDGENGENGDFKRGERPERPKKDGMNEKFGGQDKDLKPDESPERNRQTPPEGNRDETLAAPPEHTHASVLLPENGTVSTSQNSERASAAENGGETAAQDSEGKVYPADGGERANAAGTDAKDQTGMRDGSHGERAERKHPSGQGFGKGERPSGRMRNSGSEEDRDGELKNDLKKSDRAQEASGERKRGERPERPENGGRKGGKSGEQNGSKSERGERPERPENGGRKGGKSGEQNGSKSERRERPERPENGGRKGGKSGQKSSKSGSRRTQSKRQRGQQGNGRRQGRGSDMRERNAMNGGNGPQGFGGFGGNGPQGFGGFGGNGPQDFEQNDGFQHGARQERPGHRENSGREDENNKKHKDAEKKQKNAKNGAEQRSEGSSKKNRN